MQSHTAMASAVGKHRDDGNMGANEPLKGTAPNDISFSTLVQPVPRPLVQNPTHRPYRRRVHPLTTVAGQNDASPLRVRARRAQLRAAAAAAAAAAPTSELAATLLKFMGGSDVSDVLSNSSATVGDAAMVASWDDRASVRTGIVRSRSAEQFVNGEACMNLLFGRSSIAVSKPTLDGDLIDMDGVPTDQEKNVTISQSSVLAWLHILGLSSIDDFIGLVRKAYVARQERVSAAARVNQQSSNASEDRMQRDRRRKEDISRQNADWWLFRSDTTQREHSQQREPVGRRHREGIERSDGGFTSENQDGQRTQMEARRKAVYLFATHLSKVVATYFQQFEADRKEEDGVGCIDPIANSVRAGARMRTSFKGDLSNGRVRQKLVASILTSIEYDARMNVKATFAEQLMKGSAKRQEASKSVMEALSPLPRVAKDVFNANDGRGTVRKILEMDEELQAEEKSSELRDADADTIEKYRKKYDMFPVEEPHAKHFGDVREWEKKTRAALEHDRVKHHSEWEIARRQEFKDWLLHDDSLDAMKQMLERSIEHGNAPLFLAPPREKRTHRLLEKPEDVHIEPEYDMRQILGQGDGRTKYDTSIFPEFTDLQSAAPESCEPLQICDSRIILNSKLLSKPKWAPPPLMVSLDDSIRFASDAPADLGRDMLTLDTFDYRFCNDRNLAALHRNETIDHLISEMEEMVALSGEAPDGRIHGEPMDLMDRTGWGNFDGSRGSTSFNGDFSSMFVTNGGLDSVTTAATAVSGHGRGRSMDTAAIQRMDIYGLGRPASPVEQPVSQQRLFSRQSFVEDMLLGETAAPQESVLHDSEVVNGEEGTAFNHDHDDGVHGTVGSNVALGNNERQEAPLNVSDGGTTRETRALNNYAEKVIQDKVVDDAGAAPEEKHDEAAQEAPITTPMLLDSGTGALAGDSGQVRRDTAALHATFLASTRPRTVEGYNRRSSRDDQKRKLQSARPRTAASTLGRVRPKGQRAREWIIDRGDTHGNDTEDASEQGAPVERPAEEQYADILSRIQSSSLLDLGAAWSKSPLRTEKQRRKLEGVEKPKVWVDYEQVEVMKKSTTEDVSDNAGQVMVDTPHFAPNEPSAQSFDDGDGRRMPEMLPREQAGSAEEKSFSKFHDQLSNRLVAVWELLRCSREDLLKMIAKYSSKKCASALLRALPLWERVAQLIPRREAVLTAISNSLNAILPKMCAGSESPISSESFIGDLKALEHELDTLTTDIRPLVLRLSTEFEDVVKYELVPYEMKMENDYDALKRRLPGTAVTLEPLAGTDVDSVAEDVDAASVLFRASLKPQPPVPGHFLPSSCDSLMFPSSFPVVLDVSDKIKLATMSRCVWAEREPDTYAKFLENERKRSELELRAARDRRFAKVDKAALKRSHSSLALAYAATSVDVDRLPALHGVVGVLQEQELRANVRRPPQGTRPHTVSLGQCVLTGVVASKVVGDGMRAGGSAEAAPRASVDHAEGVFMSTRVNAPQDLCIATASAVFGEHA